MTQERSYWPESAPWVEESGRRDRERARRQRTILIVALLGLAFVIASFFVPGPR